MMQMYHQALSLSVDFDAAHVTSLTVGGVERLAAPTPLFRLRLRDRAGDEILLSALDAQTCALTEDGAIYSDFSDVSLAERARELRGLSVRVRLTQHGSDAEWRIAVTPPSDAFSVEWVDFPLVCLPHLRENDTTGRGGEVLFPYNEGVLVSDWETREASAFRYREPEYPSLGSYAVFPNMVFAQMLAYLWSDAGLYIGAHDAARGVKGIDFYRTDDGIVMRFRLFCGVEFGQTYEPNFPIVWSAVGGAWESAAERYRDWFASALPPRVRRITENPDLPEWYGDAPLVVTYPIRGVHDHDDMTPNRMYPYTNALPKLQAIQDATDSRLLVLLMHWEGTAPWAPPYVWPPFGDVENFHSFRRTLREQGNLLGVYCSGFGYSIQSGMIPEYNKQAEFDARGLARGMCAAPDGAVRISEICTMQRSGYDVCPASAIGEELLWEAYAPLLESGVDYAQILDQNHGGGQYFCYSREHGHPPVPGAWMTERMQGLLSRWNERAGKMLLGCESAAAEPFVGNLLFSDNRYELNYAIGRPTPLYAYLYHEYLRNFMGNQVSCPLREQDDENLWYRLAYSFSIGDCMTLVLDQDGQIRSRWGKLKTTHVPNREKILRFVGNLTRFYREQGAPYLYAGRMIEGLAVTAPTVTFARRDGERVVRLPAVLSSAWQAPDGSRAQILVNPSESEIVCEVGGKRVRVAPMSAALLKL